MQLQLTIDIRAVLLGMVLLLVVGAIAAPFAVSLADGKNEADIVREQRAALGTAFTYQGRLDSGGGPANGPHDFEFRLYDDAAPGAPDLQVGPMVAKANVQVTEGLFAVDLDFGGSAFSGDARYLEVKAKASAGGAFETLAPRQPLAATPYALHSLTTGPHDHYEEDWIDSGTNPGLSVRNTGGGTGLYGESGTSYGVWGVGGSPGAAGVYGLGSGGGGGVEGQGTPYGVKGTGQVGVEGIGGTYGGKFRGITGLRADSTTGDGILGDGYLQGLVGYGTLGHGVYGQARSDGSAGVLGYSNVQDPSLCNPDPTNNFFGFDSCPGVHGISPRIGVMGEADYSGCDNFAGGFSSYCIGVAGRAVEGNAGIGTYGYGSRVGVYGQGGSYAGYFLGHVAVTGNLTAANCCGPSDVRLKTDVRSLAVGLAEVRRLRPVTFAWSDGHDPRPHYGLVAQEVAEVVPDLVSEDPSDGYLRIDQIGLIPLLIKGMQEQQSQIDALSPGDAVAAAHGSEPTFEARLSALEGRSQIEGGGPSLPALVFAGVGLLGAGFGLGTIRAARRSHQRS